MDAVDQQALTDAVIREYRLDVAHLWLEFVGLGGDASEQLIRDYCAGEAALSPKERDTLAQAVNEHCATEGLLLRAPLSSSVLFLLQPKQHGPEWTDPYSSK
ncbi:hypothetical protein ACFFGR_13075 [Arthrobacter liuii]|uniref:Uncharacterized protein n=1 Tax=Arthrobacter liuii TaxID=1476996 RepID=A0ABQ2AYI3_9MICC|nr:hypothetical protein [Arthrobacter liuii]GGH99129.1 hypothetical protein GCM10007170_33260 [Arthrobacter liuii]